MRHAALTRRIAGDGADAWVVHDDAMARRAAGEDVLVLSMGDPDFDTPAGIVAAAEASLRRGRTHYANIGGEPALRAAIAAEAARTLGWDVDPSQVTVFPGAQAALFGVAQCLFDPGDEVVVAEPTYVTYEAVLGAPGARLVRVPLRPEAGFRLDPDAVARAIGPRTRALLLNFPHNPTGVALDDREADAVAALCRAHDLWCVSDEVYAALAWGPPHVSPLARPGMAARGVWVSSLSKSHAMTGWRCGWAVTPPETAEHLRRLARAMYFGVAPFIQDAAAAALTGADADQARLRDAYARRARLVVDALRDAPGVTARLPDGGMYVFADVRGTGLDGHRFARGLLDGHAVSVTPGEGFGPAGAGHVRITLGTGDDRLREACARIAAFARSLARGPAVPAPVAAAVAPSR